MDDLNAATLADVQTFFRTHYLPNNAVLLARRRRRARGRLRPRRRTYFGPPAGRGEAGQAGPREPLGPLPGDDRGPRPSAVVPAEAVYLSWRLPARGTRAFDALDLAFSVLGHGQTSRLHKPLVRGTEHAEAASASTLGLIGGNSFGFAYARARDGVSVEQLEDDLTAEVDRLAQRTADRAGAAPGQGPVRAALAARAGPGGLAGRRPRRVRHPARRSRT